MLHIGIAHRILRASEGIRIGSLFREYSQITNSNIAINGLAHEGAIFLGLGK